MNSDLQLVSRALQKGELERVLDWGVTADDLVSSEGKLLFTFVSDYFFSTAHRGAVPGVHMLQGLWPSFQVCDDASMTTEALCHEVRLSHKRQIAKRALKEASALIEEDPDQAMARMEVAKDLMASLSHQSSDMTFSSAVDLLLHRYARIEAGEIIHPIRWAWNFLNDLTLGIPDDAYIVLYGRPKNKKTFVTQYQMSDVYFQQQKHVLVYSKEMLAEELYERQLGFLAKLPYADLTVAKLSATDKMRMVMMAEFVKERAAASNGRQQITCVSGRDAPGRADTVTWLERKIREHKPDFVVIDGIYLMASRSKSRDRHERISEISREVRQMNMDLRIPVWATIQANRGADKSGLVADFDEVAFSDAIGQDATTGIRVVADRFDPTCNLLFPGNRKFKCNGIKINAIPCTDFSFIQDLTDEMAQHAQNQDDGSGSPVAGRRRGKAKAVAPAPDGGPPATTDVSDMLNTHLGDPR